MQELRDALEARGLDTTGLKAALVERLEAAMGNGQPGSGDVATEVAPGEEAPAEAEVTEAALGEEPPAAEPAAEEPFAATAAPALAQDEPAVEEPAPVEPVRALGVAAGLLLAPGGLIRRTSVVNPDAWGEHISPGARMYLRIRRTAAAGAWEP